MNLSPGKFRISRKGVALTDATPDDKLMFRYQTGIQQGTEWKRGQTSSVGHDANFGISLPESFTGFPLVFIMRRDSGTGEAVSAGRTPANNWVMMYKAGSNKVTIRNEGDSSVFSFLIMDTRIG